MKTYIVGGAVRDMLLSISPKDKDWVVVGARPEQMLALGFRKVSANFPVFIHPATKQEYALARTECKTGEGYYGFEPHFSEFTTLEEDLKRRDLTINSIALDENNNIIDPFHGQQDIKNRILRHTSSAFHEDPLRVIRLARFKAQLSAFNFSIASETKKLVNKIISNNELRFIAKERLYTEFIKSLKNSYIFFETLNNLNALKIIFPIIYHFLKSVPDENFFSHILYQQSSVEEKIALTFFNIGIGSLENLKNELFITNNQFKLLVATAHMNYIINQKTVLPEKILLLLKKSNILRNKNLFNKVIKIHINLVKITQKRHLILKIKFIKKVISEINNLEIKSFIKSIPRDEIKLKIFQLHLIIIKKLL